MGDCVDLQSPALHSSNRGQSDFLDDESEPLDPESDLDEESLDGALSASADFL